MTNCFLINVTSNGLSGEHHRLTLSARMIGGHQGGCTHIGGAGSDSLGWCEGVGGSTDGSLGHHSPWTTGTGHSVLPTATIQATFVSELKTKEQTVEALWTSCFYHQLIYKQILPQILRHHHIRSNAVALIYRYCHIEKGNNWFLILPWKLHKLPVLSFELLSF